MSSTASSIPAGLVSWAARPAAAKVLAEARRRLEENPSASGVLRVELDSEERGVIADLVGTPWGVSLRPVTFALLRAALTVRGVQLEELVGPLTDRRAERERRRTLKVSEEAAALDALREAGVPDHAAVALVASRLLPPAGSGGRLATAEQVGRVWAALPGPGKPESLATFAGRCCSDPHALDADYPLGRIVARLAAAVAAGGEQLVDVTGSEAWREAWATVNIACDLVSSTVLVLNLVSWVDGPGGLFGVAGEPAWLTARALMGQPWSPKAGGTIFVCENPAVVEAAADRMADKSAPLVCTFGRPSIAAWELLRRFGAGQWRLKVRADDDPVGQSIVASLLRLPGAQLWRYTIRNPAQASEPRYEEQDLDVLLSDLAGVQ